MRRIHVGLAILAFALLAPTGAQADDRQIAKQIVDKLQESKQEGELQNFSIDLQVRDGDVYLKGHVTEADHQDRAIEIARNVDGVERVYNDLEVKGTAAADESEPESSTGKVRGAFSKLNSVLVNAGRRATFIKQASHTSEESDNSSEIAKEIVDEMRTEMNRGNLRGFGVDVEVEEGVVWLKGHVSSDKQRELALDIARDTEGVRKVIDKLSVKSTARPQLLPVEASAATGIETSSDAITQEVIRRLKKQQTRGKLKNFGVDVSVDEGVVWLSGRVANQEQLQLVLDQARYVQGVKQVVNDLSVQGSQTAVLPASGVAPVISGQAARTQPAPGMLAPVSTPAGMQVPFGYVPVQYASPQMAGQGQTPVPFAATRPVSHNMQPQMGSPIPMTGSGMGIAPARFDHPQLPGYAWPSYAPYPNYGAVTYPKQHSASAWPYIGPFYPYPQVPLGWRKVTLEWDDGWWQLDFKNRH